MTSGTTEDLAARIRATDPGVLIATAHRFEIAVEDLQGEQRRLRGMREGIGPQWSGPAHDAWLDHLGRLSGRLAQAGSALHEMAGLLRQFAREAEQAKAGLYVAERLVEAAARDAPEGFAAAAKAQAHAAMAHTCELYHDAERRARSALWSLGDRAPVGLPPTPPILPLPPRPWWKRVLDVGPLGAIWLHGQHGNPYGLDEDGTLVPAYRGHPVELVRSESGVGDGLARLIPRVAKGLRGKPVLAEGDVTEAFAQTIRESYGWRDAHINTHIREWYGVKDGAEIPPWMRKEFFDKVVRASARPDKVVMGRLPSEKGLQPAYEVLYDDVATNRKLMVRFYVEGKYEGQFATAFRPTKAQTDRFLRQEAAKGS